MKTAISRPLLVLLAMAGFLAAPFQANAAGYADVYGTWRNPK